MRIERDFLGKEEVELIHEATLEILSKVGVEFQHKGAIEVFTKHGAKVEGNKVYIDKKLFETALSSIPQSFILRGRTSDKDIEIGLGKTVIGTASGPVFIREGDSRRFTTSKDFENFTKLCESSKTIEVMNGNMTEPQDIDIEKRNGFRLATSLKYSTKPLMGFTIGKADAQDSIGILQSFVGSKEKNLIMGIISVISPLTYDFGMLDSMFEYIEEDQPLMFACCSLPGATSPVTIAGTLAVNNAEVLAGIILSQLIKPGFPVIYGNTTPSCDLRYVTPAIGGVETALITTATATLGKYYGIPSRSGGSLTDSKLPDMQAGIESTLTILSPIMSGINFILQSCGILESFNVLCYEKFLIDEQNIEMVKRFCLGFDIDKDLLGREVIENVGPGGHFLQEIHTMMHFKNEHYIPYLSSRESYDMWLNNSSRTITSNAAEEIKKRLEEFEAPEITKEQRKLLSQYL